MVDDSSTSECVDDVCESDKSCAELWNCVLNAYTKLPSKNKKLRAASVRVTNLSHLRLMCSPRVTIVH